ncbi:electron transport complex subunit E [Maribacter sp. TH_r10]|uniref:Ion-translocating oxidoreductase complex subunit E n=1 Tax=Maribacter polysiphoniae TaxID=429344 RepID=A0A316ESF0_9FLAO|nr:MULTISPECIES: electron transport complex subunit E [Maribacter]MBD1262370.1 electron transport complex subunit E [Maribacter polysiphoniae]MDV7138196.1 electron transport complex subunit E [Maribacter sp. TH_r10]PWK26070.1 electron transport complex protein RnfE [Maribacter polysiphoniae]|tara:strand:+ start:120 stop:725 length:606 start_codon:yes stop_codon:yes gene_type:complete
MANTIDQKQNFLKGIVKENPIFVMLLGMCPTLGVTSSAFNGFGMGVATLFVLLMSNTVVSLVKSQIPSKVRIPAFIIIIASFVTIVEMVLEAFIPFLYEQLGIFIPLIVVNCLILGRAEAFASKNDLKSSVLDALGMGLGFVLALTVLGITREILGNGSIFDYKFVSEDANTFILFILPPGAFIALAYLSILFNKLTAKTA